MNRRELVKISAAAGVMAAAVPFSLAVKRPTVLTTQTARVTYTVTGPDGGDIGDIGRGYAIIAISWPSPFADSGGNTPYVAVGSHLYHSGQNGYPTCTLDGGNTSKTTNGISKIVYFNPAASTRVEAGDLIDVHFIGIGQV